MTTTPRRSPFRLRLVIAGLLVAGLAGSPAEAGGSFSAGAATFMNYGSSHVASSAFTLVSGALDVTVSPASNIPGPVGPSSSPTTPSAASPSPMPSFGANGALVVSTSATSSPSGTHGSGQDWGDSLGNDLYDSDKVHARLDYYMDNNKNGSQAGFGISLIIPN